jgi:hypothetical protein
VQSLSFEISVPLFGGPKISGTWAPDKAEREAAWEMYVELVTRISVEELGPEEGLLREALTSLYSLFPSTRAILRAHGPAVAKLKRGGDQSFGSIAVAILNRMLRPFLAKWHPALGEHESRRPPAESQAEWERAWERNDELRRELAAVRVTLTQYADVLAQVADVTPIHGGADASGP